MAKIDPIDLKIDRKELTEKLVEAIQQAVNPN